MSYSFISLELMPTTEDFSQTAIPQSQEQNALYDFEIGSLLFSSGNFRKSLPYLHRSIQHFLNVKDFSSYFSCYFHLLQALNDLGEEDSAKQLQKEVEETCITYNISSDPRTLAFSAYYSIYNEADYEKAKKNLNQALKTAFDRHDKYVKAGDRLKQNEMRFDIITCLYIYSIYYFTKKDYENCIQELKNLKILTKDYLQLKKEVEWDHSRTNNVQELTNCRNILEVLKKRTPSVQAMQLGLKYAEAGIEINHTKNYRQAKKLLWELYEEANKTNNTYFIPNILCAFTVCYTKLKNKKQAQMFFNLAQKNTNKERKPLLLYMESLKQEEKLDQSGEASNYDLIFDIQDHLIVEKEKGCIELKNQFILMDLLRLFLLNPGISYSKEKIIQKVWKQDYFPETHDNKIYVTIKRLREMIEINPSKPKYICRNNAGYYFSKQVKILIKQNEKEL